MHIQVLISIFIISIIIQTLLYSIAKNPIIKYLPFILVTVGYLWCLSLWLGAFDSIGDVASNRWLAIIFSIIFSGIFVGALIGVLIGVVISKLLKRRNK